MFLGFRIVVIKLLSENYSLSQYENLTKTSFSPEYYNSYLASNRSYIVASIDVRGSGAMGVDALHAVNGALGSVEITDTLATIR